MVKGKAAKAREEAPSLLLEERAEKLALAPCIPKRASSKCELLFEQWSTRVMEEEDLEMPGGGVRTIASVFFDPEGGGGYLLQPVGVGYLVPYG